MRECGCVSLRRAASGRERWRHDRVQGVGLKDFKQGTEDWYKCVVFMSVSIPSEGFPGAAESHFVLIPHAIQNILQAFKLKPNEAKMKNAWPNERANMERRCYYSPGSFQIPSCRNASLGLFRIRPGHPFVSLKSVPSVIPRFFLLVTPLKPVAWICHSSFRKPCVQWNVSRPWGTRCLTSKPPATVCAPFSTWCHERQPPGRADEPVVSAEFIKIRLQAGEMWVSPFWSKLYHITLEGISEFILSISYDAM